MKIGNLDFGKYPLLLAPMEDVTDESFRLMCKEFGADMVYTEFVSSDALVRNINSTMRKLSIQDAERPVAIQIYGRFVDAMVDAARRCEEANPDVLDINFGCPGKKGSRQRRRSRYVEGYPVDVENYPSRGRCRENTGDGKNEVGLGP